LPCALRAPDGCSTALAVAERNSRIADSLIVSLAAVLSQGNYHISCKDATLNTMKKYMGPVALIAVIIAVVEVTFYSLARVSVFAVPCPVLLSPLERVRSGCACRCSALPCVPAPEPPADREQARSLVCLLRFRAQLSSLVATCIIIATSKKKEDFYDNPFGY
jgi:hypothetical protein